MKCLSLEIKFEGGLGNQMFQYAVGRCISIENNIPFFLLNTQSFVNQPLQRKFTLANFRIKGEIIESDFVKKLFRKQTKLNSIAKFFRAYNSIDDSWQLKNLSLQLHPFTSLNGYWQSPEYFKSIRSILLEELIPEIIPEFPVWIANDNTVAVHVRRTDYLEESRYGFVGLSYYAEAIRYMEGKIANAFFIFFSDDLEWCKQNFKISNAVFFEKDDWQSDYLQLYLISQCNHQIIANSSFSWWGAWLNDKAGRIVIRPSRPFKDSSLLYPFHYPAEWIDIDNSNE